MPLLTTRVWYFRRSLAIWGVLLVDVFVTMFFTERVVSSLPNPPLFSAGLGTGHGRVIFIKIK